MRYDAERLDRELYSLPQKQFDEAIAIYGATCTHDNDLEALAKAILQAKENALKSD